MNERKKRIQAICEQAAKNQHPVFVDWLPRSTVRAIKKEVQQFNKKNTVWECNCYFDDEADCMVFTGVTNDRPKPPNADFSGVVKSLDVGGDMDIIIRDFYDLALKNDVAIIDQPINRRRAVACVTLWNGMGWGNIIVRLYCGQLYFYRREWRRGRNLAKALDIWERSVGQYLNDK